MTPVQAPAGQGADASDFAESRLIAGLAAMFRTPADDERECRLTEEQALSRLCSLMGKVRAHLGGPADCFCPGTYRDPTGYRNDGTAIAFIEEATLAALSRATGSDL